MYGLQGLGDHHVAVDGDGQQGDHGGDTKQGAAECIHLTAYQQTNKRLRQQHRDAVHVVFQKCKRRNEDDPFLQTPIPCRDS